MVVPKRMEQSSSTWAYFKELSLLSSKSPSWGQFVCKIKALEVSLSWQYCDKHHHLWNIRVASWANFIGSPPNFSVIIIDGNGHISLARKSWLKNKHTVGHNDCTWTQISTMVKIEIIKLDDSSFTLYFRSPYHTHSFISLAQMHKGQGVFL